MNEPCQISAWAGLWWTKTWLSDFSSTLMYIYITTPKTLCMTSESPPCQVLCTFIQLFEQIMLHLLCIDLQVPVILFTNVNMFLIIIELHTLLTSLSLILWSCKSRVCTLCSQMDPEACLFGRTQGITEQKTILTNFEHCSSFKFYLGRTEIIKRISQAVCKIWQ